MKMANKNLVLGILLLSFSLSQLLPTVPVTKEQQQAIEKNRDEVPSKTERLKSWIKRHYKSLIAGIAALGIGSYGLYRVFSRDGSYAPAQTTWGQRSLSQSSPGSDVVLKGAWRDVAQNEFGGLVATSAKPFHKTEFIKKILGKDEKAFFIDDVQRIAHTVLTEAQLRAEGQTEEEAYRSAQWNVPLKIKVPSSPLDYQKFKDEHFAQFIEISSRLAKQLPPAVKAGNWNEYTIQELRDAPVQPHSVFTEPGFVKVIADGVAIENLQARKGLKGATFQVASRLTALEGAFYLGDGGAGSLEHMAGGTQGEQASLSAGGAALARCYLMPVINLIKGLGANFNELQEPEAFLKKVMDSKKTDAEKSAFVDKIRTSMSIGNHQGVLVTSTSDGSKDHSIQVSAAQGQTINQIFTAALRWRERNWSSKADLENVWYQKIAQAVVDAAYEGTLRAAYHAGSQKVVLTLVGGGVFQNPWEWIASSIERMKDFIKDKKMQVYLVYWPSHDSSKNSMLNIRMQQVADYVASAK